MTLSSSLEETLRARFDVASVEVTVGSLHFELFKPRNADDLLDEEEFEFDDRIPYWADLWPSARVVAERLVNEPGQGASFLELGCGVGLCSLAAARAGFDVLATDYYDDALRFVTLNAEHNNVRNLATRMVDWRNLPADLGHFDRIVAADVLYEKPYCDLVARTIRTLLAPRGEALVADPGRRVAAEFPDHCRRQRLEVVAHERVVWVQEPAPVTIDLYRLRHE
ncbi:MAG TPA: methyltransferase domain-containing protein [Pirellulales bacterium]|nr:methyltransferase domain-containing protein [Pirellulales bacterium]